MEREIKTYGGYFESFMETLDESTQEKIQYGLLLLKTQERLSTKFVKAIRNGLFELRILWEGNTYRIFFCFDEGNIVVVFNCFQKKTQKTPQTELVKAQKYKKDYERRHNYE